MDHTNLLVALSFDSFVLGPLGNAEALLEKLQGEVELTLLKIVVRNLLVNVDEVDGDLSEDRLKLAAVSFLHGGFQMVHRLELVEHFLLALTEALVCESFTLLEVELLRNLEAPLVEVGSRFEVVHVHVHDCHFVVGFETVANGAIALTSITPEQFALLKHLADLCQHLGGVFQSLL